MSYLVLARKWRPRNFAEVAGQEHIVRTLQNAIELNRLHHAYLFTGTRGVGKTTIARILARCLNCKTGPTPTPCGTCSACVEIDEGRYIDLIEVDAASRTGVDNMRELLDNVQYAPSSGQYKIYLIDEVHMLSISSFNALLKTLEEPPPHVQFLFATTNPQKIPMTILSRCLQLNLTRIDNQTISNHLKKLLTGEDIAYEERALEEIVISAQGSMRDALSLLDQAIAYGNGKLEAVVVNDMLGLGSRDQVYEILRCIAQRDVNKVMEIINQLYQNAADFSSTIHDFIDILHQIALHQALPQCPSSPRFNASYIAELAGAIEPEDVQLAYQIALSGKQDMPLVGDDKSAIEMIMLRILNFTPLTQEAMQHSSAGDKPPAEIPATDKAAQQTASDKQPNEKPVPPQREAPAATGKQPNEKLVPPQREAPAATGRHPNEKAVPPQAQASAANDKHPDEKPVPPQREAPAATGRHPNEKPASPQAQASAAAPHTTSNPEDDLFTQSSWSELIEQMQLSGTERQICYNAVMSVVAPDHIALLMEPSTLALCNEESRKAINQALNDIAGRTIQLDIREKTEANDADKTPAQAQSQAESQRQHQAKVAVENNPDVLTMKDAFDATIVEGTIRPMDTKN